MAELTGRTALVTGASRGIGLAIGRELARAGASAVLVSRASERLEQATAALRDEGLDACGLVADIDAPGFLERLAEDCPRVDVLVNNAASFAPYGPLEAVEQADLDQVLRTTLGSAMRLVRHVLPGMKERGFGRILNVGSVAGRVGGAGQVAYSTAKSALVGLTVTVAVECARHGVTSNLLELGLIDTERVRAGIEPEVRAALVRNTPLGRPGSVEEVAWAARFLASPGASYVTGAVLPVSGGLGLGLYPEQLERPPGRA